VRVAGGMLASVSSRRIASLSVCAVLALALAAPATTFAALGGSSAFSELTEGQTQTETTPTQTTATSATTETTNSNSSGVLVIAGGAALLLLGGIAFLIMRDARRVAPAGDGLLGKGGSGHDTAAMMRKRRAKAKAARRQRKQNLKRSR
jgi:hypothetical protein